MLFVINGYFLAFAGDLEVWVGEHALQMPFWPTTDYPEKWKFFHLPNVVADELNELALCLFAFTFIQSIEDNQQRLLNDLRFLGHEGPEGFNNELLERYPASLLKDTGATSEASCKYVLVLRVSVSKLIREGGNDTIRIVPMVGPREEQGSTKSA